MDPLDQSDVPHLLQSIRDSLRELVEQNRWAYLLDREKDVLRIDRVTGAVEWLDERANGRVWVPLHMEEGKHE